MRRRAKPGKAKVEPKRPVARKSLKNEGSRVRQLQKRLGEALKREAEAQEQQRATAEILRVMSSSLAQLQPVLDAIAERAARLCDASNGTIILSDGEALRMEAHYGPLAGGRLPSGQSDGCPLGDSDIPRGAAGSRGRADWPDHDAANRNPPLFRQADRAAEDLCRPGRHRHRERAALYRAAAEERGAHSGARPSQRIP